MGRAHTDRAQAEPFRLAQSPSHLLHRAEQLANDRFARLVGDGVTLRQFTLMAAIAEQPGLSQNDLVRATGIDRSTMAEMIARMVQRGWIVRAASQTDARAYEIRLNVAGADLLIAAAPHAKAADAAILDALTSAKRKSFLNTLAKLAAAADKTAAKAEREARRQAKRSEQAHAKEKPAKGRGKRA